MGSAKPKILFFAEGATLAHVARPFVLAQTLDAAQFDVSFARPTGFDWLTARAPFQVLPLECQDPTVFARQLERGQPLYNFRTLERYVEDDLALIDAVRPDIVVGDFRLSLAVSARLRSVPYATICDAYWSPERPLQPPLPVLNFTRFTPIPLASAIFGAVAPLALRLHARPLERLRARHGLPSLDHDLRRCYTDADLRLFANFPELFPEVTPGPQAAFVGPVAWSPPSSETAIPFPQDDGSLIYVTMGSSGDPQVLQALVPVLEATGSPVFIATAGKRMPALPRSDRIRVFDYLPGDLVCARARLVVCNGGSPTTNQALANGVPVLGIAKNMDQFLNMQAIERFGAGITVRADRASVPALRSAVDRLTNGGSYPARAAALAQHEASGRLSFADLLAGLLHATA